MTKVISENKSISIDACGVTHQNLNDQLRDAVNHGVMQIELRNVCGQRYIGTDLHDNVQIDIYGVPGNDLGAFMNGPRISVHNNAQDGCGNTMNDGEIVIHGRAGDILGLSARGGKIFVRDSVGYRAGIHLKEYQEKRPQIVIGGTAQDFFCEYMSGGVVVLLGLNLKEGERHKANFIGTGMHGGVIYLTGEVNGYQLGKEVGIASLDESDRLTLGKLVTEFCLHFGTEPSEILTRQYVKLYPKHLRPYGRLYTY